jgi:hypothetical protein
LPTQRAPERFAEREQPGKDIQHELLTAVRALNTLRWRLETEPVEATEYFCPVQVKRKATRVRKRDD